VEEIILGSWTTLCGLHDPIEDARTFAIFFALVVEPNLEGEPWCSGKVVPW